VTATLLRSPTQPNEQGTRRASKKQPKKATTFPKEKKRKELVLGRFWESIRKDSIRLGIFAGEREDSIQKSKNRFRIGHDYFAKIGITPLKSPSFGVYLTKISSQINVNALCKQ
jgi:hypothetical protein